MGAEPSVAALARDEAAQAAAAPGASGPTAAEATTQDPVIIGGKPAKDGSKASEAIPVDPKEAGKKGKGPKTGSQLDKLLAGYKYHK